MKNFILSLFLLMLLLQAIEKTLNIPRERSLKGSYVLTRTDSLTPGNWFSGRFQQSHTTSFNERIGYKPTLVRLFNQINYSVFNMANGSDIAAGKSGYLYQFNYIYAFTGKDRRSINELRKKMGNVYKVQKYLEKRGKHFLLVFAPNKARIFPEFIPSRLLKKGKSLTNYDEYLEIIRNEYPDLHFMDMNEYFTRLKGIVKVPLYSKGGIHWTNYVLDKYFMDTLVRKMSSMQNQRYPKLIERNFHWTYDLIEPDNDLRQLMNLYKSKQDEKLPYADFSYKPDPGFIKPGILVISDSYYSILYGSPVFNSILSKNNFWYYNHTRYPDVDYKGNPDPEFLTNDLVHHDFVILMATEMNIPDLFQFPEEALTWFGIADSMIINAETHRQERIRHYISIIRQSPNWLNKIRAQMKDRHESLEELIRDNAEYMEKKEHQIKK